MTPEQRALADAVARELDLKPAPGFDSPWARLFSLADGGRLTIASASQRGQLSISTSVADPLRDHRPQYRDGEAPRTRINLAAIKDARRIASEVRRRLLPEYEREASACQAARARHEERIAGQVKALVTVAAPFGERVHCEERSGEPRPLRIERAGVFRLTARPGGQGVRIEIEVPPPVAERIAALLATL